MRSMALLLSCCLLPLLLFAQSPSQPGQGKLLGKTPTLPLLEQVVSVDGAQAKAKSKMRYPREIENFRDHVPMPTPFAATALPKGPDPLAAHSKGLKNFLPITPELTFDGMDAGDANAIPPDPAGDVSPDYYVQMINVSRFSVYDKAGNQLFGPFNFNLVWNNVNTTAIGDPIVLWDHAAGRWLVSEMGTNNALLIAVSETDDPTGSWFVYEFLTPSLPDYPKYAIWPDAVVVTTNEFEQDIPVYAINRQALLAGAGTVPIQRLEALPKFNTFDAFQVATPADWDGSNPPPAGSPFFVLRMYDDAWNGGADALEVWSISIDWNNSNNTQIEGPLVLPTEPFNSVLCEQSFFECIAQPSGSYVSALEQVLMYRVQYRHFDTHESMVLNHVVDVDPAFNQAGIRWYELRKEGGGDWYIYQQGTYAPDGLDRFMASIAMDAEGNILMGYSITGSDQLLSLRFTGRLAGDPLGEMTVTEYTFAEGLSNNNSVRWGDYAAMSVDPVDERTFWFNGEYMLQGGDFGTKILVARIRRDSFDIGASTLVAPQNSGFLTAAEPVTVGVRNYGYLPVANYSVSFSVDEGPVFTEMIADTLLPDSTYWHTFATTADLSVIGPYHFQVFTDLPLDTFSLNDTLRKIVRKLTRNDAAIVGLTDMDAPICGETLETSILLRNEGVDTLFSVDVYYEVNNSGQNLINWTGQLLSGAQEAIPISVSGILADGPDNEIVAYSTLPNGLSDEDPANDTLQRSFTMSFEGQEATLLLETDFFPQETTWELTDMEGNLLYSGGPYGQPQTVFTEKWCLPPGCYLFSLFDSFGDGISAQGISGNYYIFNESGQLLANLQNPDFGFEEKNFFCNESGCALQVFPLVNDASGPSTPDGLVVVTATNGFAPYQYSLNGGATYQSNSLFFTLLPGDYALSVKDAAGCQLDTLITVGYPTSVQPSPSGPSLTLQPNPTENAAFLTITGLQDPNAIWVQVLDATGRAVRHQQLPCYGDTHRAQIALGGLPAGVYYVRVVHERLVAVEPLVKE